VNDHRWAKAGSVPFEAWHSNRGTGGKASVAGGDPIAVHFVTALGIHHYTYGINY
jgi:hypothetical protein